MLKYNLSHGFKIFHMLFKNQDTFFSNYRECLYAGFNLFIGSLPGLWTLWASSELKGWKTVDFYSEHT